MADKEEKAKAKQLQDYANVANKPPLLGDSLADSLTALQAGIATSKETVKAKNIEIPTIKFEMAAKDGDVLAMTAAAKEIAKASEYGPFQTKTFVDSIVKKNTPVPVTISTNATTFNPYTNTDTTGYKVVNGVLLFNGQPFSGTYEGQTYENGKVKVVTDDSKINIPPGLDAATTALIESLKLQISNLTASNQQSKIDAAAEAAAAKAEKTQNAITVLTDRFKRYNLASLVPKIRELAIAGASESTITLQLQETEEYQQRFSANKDRIKKNLAVLNPGEYIALEDRYRQIIRAYGLKDFDNDNYVNQFISNDVSPEELSNRVVTAVQRVKNADPAITATLRDFYGIGQNDLVAYVLDPNQTFQKIERQVAAAEIGTAARKQGLEAGVNVAEQLAAQGISQAEAQRGYSTIADILPEATKLSNLYGNTLDKYGQSEAEQDIFNTLASAQRKRKNLIGRETAEFTGTSGLSRTALGKTTGGTY
jgi:hypothetical protein